MPPLPHLLLVHQGRLKILFGSSFHDSRYFPSFMSVHSSLSFLTKLSVITSNSLPNKTLYAGFVITCICKYTVIHPKINGTFLANPKVCSTDLFTLSISMVMSGSHGISNSFATFFDMETICEPGSNNDSTSPTLFIKGYTALSPCDSFATTIFFGFSPGCSVKIL